jgi:hypothetical protein
MEAVYASSVGATTAANILRQEDGLSRFITDTELPRFAADGTPDDRIVWRQGEPTDAARKWMLEQLRREVLTNAPRVRP